MVTVEDGAKAQVSPRVTFCGVPLTGNVMVVLVEHVVATGLAGGEVEPAAPAGADETNISPPAPSIIATAPPARMSPTRPKDIRFLL
jgi:hypothetical protein